MPNYSVTLYDRDGTVRTHRTTARVSTGAVALDAVTSEYERERADKIVIERLREPVTLSPEDADKAAKIIDYTYARIFNEAAGRSGPDAPKLSEMEGLLKKLKGE